MFLSHFPPSNNKHNIATSCSNMFTCPYKYLCKYIHSEQALSKIFVLKLISRTKQIHHQHLNYFALSNSCKNLIIQNVTFYFFLLKKIKEKQFFSSSRVADISPLV